VRTSGDRGETSTVPKALRKTTTGVEIFPVTLVEFHSLPP